MTRHRTHRPDTGLGSRISAPSARTAQGLPAAITHEVALVAVAEPAQRRIIGAVNGPRLSPGLPQQDATAAPPGGQELASEDLPPDPPDRGERAGQPDPDLTAALCDLAAGSPGADARVMPLIYARLRALAERHLTQERPGHTLQPTALVNEAYMKLVDQRIARWESRAQFFAFAAHAMRRILLDHAKARGRVKRGGGLRRVGLEDADTPTPSGAPGLDLSALDEALERLAAHDAAAARVVEMRFFAGMEVEAIASVLGVTDRTVRRHWVYAKAWLGRELAREAPPAQGAP